MSEMSDMGKLEMAMRLSKVAQVGLELTYFDVIELLGELESLKSYIAELETKIRHNALWQASEDAEERAHLEKLVPDLKKRIAELEGKIDQLTAHSDIERQDDKCSKPEPNVCEACGGDGTVVLRDGYEGQVIATVKCTYCNGTGRVNKEREKNG